MTLNQQLTERIFADLLRERTATPENLPPRALERFYQQATETAAVVLHTMAAYGPLDLAGLRAWRAQALDSNARLDVLLRVGQYICAGEDLEYIVSSIPEPRWLVAYVFRLVSEGLEGSHPVFITHGYEQPTYVMVEQHPADGDDVYMQAGDTLFAFSERRWHPVDLQEEYRSTTRTLRTPKPCTAPYDEARMHKSHRSALVEQHGEGYLHDPRSATL